MPNNWANERHHHATVFDKSLVLLFHINIWCHFTPRAEKHFKAALDGEFLFGIHTRIFTFLIMSARKIKPNRYFNIIALDFTLEYTHRHEQGRNVAESLSLISSCRFDSDSHLLTLKSHPRRCREVAPCAIFHVCVHGVFPRDGPLNTDVRQQSLGGEEQLGDIRRPQQSGRQNQHLWSTAPSAGGENGSLWHKAHGWPECHGE